MHAKKYMDGRRADRIRCSFRGTLTFLHQTADVRVIDISRLGMAIEVFGWLDARSGAVVKIRTHELGLIEATVRWYRAGKMGLQVEESSNTAAQIASYFKHFHKPVVLHVVK
ncbi:PilZ domain-containing protein [Ciceribacter sp. L1K23]|uniref:PilZ domain-containing protein n=1 Tax=unclassified Ciceribacter TaxID=2628820 RepID=UPI001ABED851|nr:MULTISPECIES: PilZ domain-containing protein [unclassified Ciceribacter]MBO3760006.1 PilZ domain-containing protein [Ciceribacter sp. L1K22]MBR0555846.1 PilZ domain-containing protein [Ciceribacter sp. L1K23]